MCDVQMLCHISYPLTEHKSTPFLNLFTVFVSGDRYIRLPLTFQPLQDPSNSPEESRTDQA